MATDFSKHLPRVLERLANKTATYAPAAGGESASISVLFEDEYRVDPIGSGMGSTVLAAVAKLVDVPSARKGDALQIDGVGSFVVSEPQKHAASGTVRLILRKA